MPGMERSLVHARLAHAHIRMVAEPASVPAARRWVDDALSGWGREDMVEDVALCVTELSTNATLHSGSRFFEIELERGEEAVRLSVVDTGATTVEALATRSELAEELIDQVAADDAPTTGRGMFIVSALASCWGIDELPGGKRVWAEFSGSAGSPESYDAQPPRLSHTGSTAEPVDPDAWAVVRFLDCPVALLRAHDDNLADTIRELQLLGDHLQHPEFARLARLLAGHVARHAANWDAAKLQVLEATRAGEELADIHVLSPRDVMGDVKFLRDLIWETEALAREGKLITLPAPPEVQVLRDWLESEFRRQAVEGRDPVSYPDWLAQRG